MESKKKNKIKQVFYQMSRQRPSIPDVVRDLTAADSFIECKLKQFRNKRQG